MFLPDPRSEVIVQRILTQKECSRYYPGNQKVAEYNRMLEEQNDPLTELAGAQVELKGFKTGHSMSDVTASVNLSSSNYTLSRAADQISRGAQYTPPKRVVLDRKLFGAPKIMPWTGFAVKTIDARGEGEVIVGPKTINLRFDQTLEPIFVSKGTPKNHERLEESVYLKIDNNVSDELVLTTQDLVEVRVRVKYLARFLADQKDRWFNIANYVQLLVDHFRSSLSARARSEATQELFLGATEKLRGWILGEDGKGKTFAENGLQVYDVEILSVKIDDAVMAAELRKTLVERLKANLAISQIETETRLALRREVKTREILSSEAQTHEHRVKIQVEQAVLDGSVETKQVQLSGEREKLEATYNKEIAEIKLETQDLDTKTELLEWETEKTKLIFTHGQEMEDLLRRAEAQVKVSGSVSPHLTAAIQDLADSGKLEVVAKHLGNLALLGDMSLSGTIKQVFKGTPFEKALDNLASLGRGKLIASPDGE